MNLPHQSAEEVVVRLPRRAWNALKISAVLIAIGGSTVLIDSAFAIHAEKEVGAAIKEVSGLESTPGVYVGGFPYLAAGFLAEHEIPLIEIRALDIEVEQFGLINAFTKLRDVNVTREQVLSGNFNGAEVSTLSHSIILDGVALGKLFGITDLQIANPKNISPSGGVSTEAELTGTLPGDEEPTTTVVDLRLVNENFIMTPVTAPSAKAAEIFSFEMDTRQLPLPHQASMVRLLGGSLEFETQTRDTIFDIHRLSPVEIDGDFDELGNRK
ncbi:MAG: DUF2993 domain-containing protein [Corynebacterium sp.]|nr:DUF2993 domain-containing protein [Corynebacterium sp.]